jgi:hypothetical protein
MKLLVLAAMLALGRVAHATGPCENTGPRYDPPELFDAKTRSFAIPVSQPWCDVTVDGEVLPPGEDLLDQLNRRPLRWTGGVVDENRGTVEFVELRDVNNHVIGILSTVQGADAERLWRAVGVFEEIPVGKLHATLLARGYAPLVVRAKDCKLSTAWTDVEPGGGWRGATLQLDVQRSGKRLLRAPLGKGSIERRGDQFIRAHVLAKQASVAVFAIVPSCAGPPPGDFGPDFGGECYRVNTPVAMLFDAKTLPSLAACF